MRSLVTTLKEPNTIGNTSGARKQSSFVRRIRKFSYCYVFFLPVFIYFVLFHYRPMYGVIIAFKKFNFSDGILGSPWVGLEYFRQLFTDSMFSRVVRNTIVISVLRIIFGFPAPIILALLLEEIKHVRFKKFSQSVSYLPHFISWMILGSIVKEVFSPSRGIVNFVISLFGVTPIHFLTEPAYFRAILITTGIWASVGWASIVYLAAISGIDSQLYESAVIDGAGRFKRIRFITIPSIMPVIAIIFILGLGGVMNAGFDQVFNLYNPMVYRVADIIDTYVYRVGLASGGGNFSYTTAVGLFKNVIGLALLLTVNTIVRKFGDYAIW